MYKIAPLIHIDNGLTLCTGVSEVASISSGSSILVLSTAGSRIDGVV